jgi:N-acetylmuramoyl-L-alanine amidase
MTPTPHHPTPRRPRCLRVLLAGLVLCCGWLVAGPVAAACDPAGLAVALDVGHTQQSPGATSARGVPEFQFNRILAQAVLAALKADGFGASFLINADGTIGSLAARTAEAARRHAGLFLAIHHDSVQPRYLAHWTFDGRDRRYSDRFHGYSLFISGRQPEPAASQRLAGNLGRALRAAGFSPSLHHAEPIPGEGRTLLDPDLGLYRYDGLVVLKTAHMPAVLLEAGIILNRDEETALADPAVQQRLAAAVAAGVRAYCQDAPAQR